MSRSAFVPALLLGLILLAVKLTMVGVPRSWDEAGDFIAVSAEDIAVVIGFGLASAWALWLTRGRPALERLTWRAVVVTGTVAAFYGVLHIGIYGSMGHPFNIRMLALVGRVGDLRSSIAAQVSLGLVAGVVGTPVAYAMALRVRPGHPALPGTRAARAVVIALAVMWSIGGMAMQARAMPDGWLRRIGKNAHRELVGSVFAEALLSRRVALGDEFPAEYLSDFRLAGERPPVAPLPQLPGGEVKNVIVVVLESTSTYYMSLYGSPFDTTPNLKAEARHAMVSDAFYTHVPYTFCSMMPIVYSVYPGLPWSWRPKGPRPMPKALAAVLAERGYRTAYFSAANLEWHGMGLMAKEAGFQVVHDNHDLEGEAVSSWGTEDRAVIDGLLKWIGPPGSGDAKRPFYAVCWTDQTHHPYTLARGVKPVDFLDERTQKAHPRGELLERYLNAVREVDVHLGRLFAELRARGLADDTVVIVTGDHGEAFGDPHETVGHGSALYDEGVRVPLMIWNPRMFPSPQRMARPGGHVDLGPTIAHLLGVEPVSDWQGASLLGDRPGRTYFMADLGDMQFGVRDHRYKYVLNVTAGAQRLYDMLSDPLERRDLSAEQPEVARQFRDRISAFVKAEEAYIKGQKTAD